MQREAENNDGQDKANRVCRQSLFHEKAESYMRQNIVDGQKLLVEATCTDNQAPMKSEAYERIDPYTLEIITKIFPAPAHGLDFLARLLRNAQVVQAVLPGLEESGDLVAIINARTIRLLATSIHMAYDTTHKYVATFCALGLLHRYKYNQQCNFVFPLRRYNPPTSLQALDHLIMKSRPKVQQFARGVKKRFLALNLRLCKPEVVDYPRVDFINEKQWLRTILTPMLGIMRSEGIEKTQGQRIAIRVVNEVLSKLPLSFQPTTEPSSLYETNGEKVQVTHIAAISKQNKIQDTKKSTILDQKGRLLAAQTPAEVDTFTVDAVAERRKRCQILTQKYIQAVAAKKVYQNQQNQPQMVDSAISNQPSDSDTTQQQKVDSDTTTAEGVDSGTTVVEEVDPNSDSSERVDAAKESAEEIAESTYLDNCMRDLLMLYDNLLHDESIDWSWVQLPKAFIEELYTNLCNGYTFSQDGITSHPQNTTWTEIESHAIEQLAAKYQYDFSTVYHLLLYYTYRHDEDPSVEGLKSTTASILVDQDGPATVGLPEKEAQEGAIESTLSHEIVDPSPTEKSTLPSQKSTKKVDLKTKSTQKTADRKRKSTGKKKTFQTQKPADMSEDEYKHTLLLKLDFAPEDLESPMALNLLAKGLEYVEELAENYQRTKTYWKDLDEQALAEQKEKLRIPSEVDPKRHSEEFNDLLRKRNISLLFNNIYNNITLRKELKVFLAEIFDCKHVNLADDWFKVVDECDAQQLCAGFIDTVVLLHSPTSKPIEKPGGFFNSRCRTIRDNGLPDDSEKRIVRFGTLTYAELVTVLLKICERRNS